MPKVVYSDTKGLVQETGTGFAFVTGNVSDKIGLHLYQEEVTLTEVDIDKVTGLLSKKLPENSIILNSSIITSSVGTGLVELRCHTSLLDIDDGIGGTTQLISSELDECTPDIDLDVSELGQTVANLNAKAIENNQFLFLASQVDGAITGTPKVVVSILYIGKGEPELI